MTGAQLTVSLVLGWLLIGVVVGTRLTRSGHGAATACSAIVAWPALLSLTSSAPRSMTGPYADRIAQAFLALGEALGDPSAAAVPWREDALALQSVLEAADRRLVLVDRLLQDEDGDGDAAVAESRAALARARTHAAHEIEAVLAGVVELRLHVGLLSLAGDPLPVRERLRGLRARARALAEVDGLQSLS